MAFWSEDEYISNIRLRIKDTAALNRLLGTEESSEDLIKLCINKALEDFNFTIPTTTYVITNFPRPYFLMDSAVVEILISAGIFYSRNALSYNDGSLSINDFEDKDQRYINWIQIFIQRVEKQKQDWKLNINIKRGSGGVISPYRNL